MDFPHHDPESVNRRDALRGEDEFMVIDKAVGNQMLAEAGPFSPPFRKGSMHALG